MSQVHYSEVPKSPPACVRTAKIGFWSKDVGVMMLGPVTRSVFGQLSGFILVLTGAEPLVRATPPAAPKAVATLQSVTVTSTANGVSVEIVASQPLAPRSQVTTDPDRLVLDFANSQPAGDLHSKLLNQGDIKGFRVARYSANPPTTR